MKLKTKMKILEWVYVPVVPVLVLLILLDGLTKGRFETLKKVIYAIDNNTFGKLERYHLIELERLERRWRDTCKILGRKYTKISELPKIGNKK